MDDLELKPCPFCGGEAQLQLTKGEDVNFIKVECKVCGARVKSVATNFPVREETWKKTKHEQETVIDRWNRRNLVSCSDCVFFMQDEDTLTMFGGYVGGFCNLPFGGPSMTSHIDSCTHSISREQYKKHGTKANKTEKSEWISCITKKPDVHSDGNGNSVSDFVFVLTIQGQELHGFWDETNRIWAASIGRRFKEEFITHWRNSGHLENYIEED